MGEGDGSSSYYLLYTSSRAAEAFKQPVPKLPSYKLQFRYNNKTANLNFKKELTVSS